MRWCLAFSTKRSLSGVYHLQCQHFDIAIERLASVINTLHASGQDLADVTFHLGRAYQKKRLATLNATPENERGRLRSQLSGCYKSAVTYLTQATELDPDFALAHFRLGQLKTETNCERSILGFQPHSNGEAIRRAIRLTIIGRRSKPTMG